MSIDAKLVQKVRQATGVSLMKVKKALEAAGGDEVKAVDILRKQGSDVAAKKADREAREGIIGTYVHPGSKIVGVVKLQCETDFVARNEEFQNLARDLAMHVAASDPRFISPDDVSADEIEKERDIYMARMKQEGKPANIAEKAVAGKLKKYREEISFMTQPFVKDPDITVQALIHKMVTKLGENIQVTEIKRFSI